MSEYYIGSSFDNEYLAHHGILGQKWGIRRYQNPDGSLTAAGRAKYGVAYSKGVPVSKLKEAIKDYNTRTGQNIKLKDVNTVRIGKNLYDKKGRIVKQNTDVSSIHDKKKESKTLPNNNQNDTKPKNKPSILSDVGAVIKQSALQVGGQWLTKQLKSAVGLDAVQAAKLGDELVGQLYKKKVSQMTLDEAARYYALKNNERQKEIAEKAIVNTKKEELKEKNISNSSPSNADIEYWINSNLYDYI